MPQHSTRTDIQPVIVGGDIGAYSLSRAFHEAYGIRSIVISTQLGWHIARSAIIENRLIADTMDPQLLAAELTRIEAEVPASKRLILLGSADATVKTIIRVREELNALTSDRWVVPYVGLDAFEAATEKQNFTALCQKVGVDHPTTEVFDLAQPVPAGIDLPFQYPVIAKPADVSAWKSVQFEGKSKVHTVDSEQDLVELLSRIQRGGYDKAIIVQDMIPGDDQNMRILTAYCDKDSRIRFASWGHTLLEEHSPGAIGNPAAIITGRNDRAVEQAQKIVSELGWIGYANFDLKYDPRTGKTVFFELNPRLGRSNYYVTAGGHNPVEYYVREYIDGTLGESGEIIQDQDEVLYAVVPVALVKHYTTNPESRALLRRALKNSPVRNPLRYPGVETDFKRRATFIAAMANYVRKFRRYYRPEQAS